MKSNEPREVGWLFPTVAVVVGPIGLLFLPLVLSLAEHLMFGSSYVEGFCRKISVHEVLRKVYEPIVPLIQKLIE